MHRTQPLLRAGLIRLFAIGLAATLPLAAENLVGTLPGEFSVNNTGTANYSISLPIPPGRGGMQPSLALAYNSSGGNGLLGVGWSIATGFPHSITRGRTILARDGIVRGVCFDANDKLYLDGKRLLHVSGTDGQAGSTYRTEVESFQAISAGRTDGATSGVIHFFRVETKEGLILTFGKTDETESDGYQTLGGESQDLAYEWCLKEIKDRRGYRISLHYRHANESANRISEWVLDEIRYSYGTSAQHGITVKLTYNSDLNAATDEVRPDLQKGYRYGGRYYSLTRRLHYGLASKKRTPKSGGLGVLS